MSFAKNLTTASIAFLMTAGPALAQAGGSDVPSDAKKAGTIENGRSTTGVTSGRSMTKSAPSTNNDDKQTKTGGNSGGPINGN